MIKKHKLVYLATPYSHPDKEVRQKRFDIVNELAAKLMRHGIFVFSPISHCHCISIKHDLPTGWGYWEDYDLLMLSKCDSMFVVMQDGWKESVGIKSEINAALNLGLPVTYIHPDDRLLDDFRTSNSIH